MVEPLELDEISTIPETGAPIQETTALPFGKQPAPHPSGNGPGSFGKRIRRPSGNALAPFRKRVQTIQVTGFPIGEWQASARGNRLALQSFGY